MSQQLEPQQKLQRLHGAWVGEERIHPSPFDPAGGTATGRAVNRPALRGQCVVQEYTQYRGGGTSFEGHGVFWFDPGRAEYVMTWFDSMRPGTSEFRGTFEGDVLALTARAPEGQSRATFAFTGPHGYRFVLEVSGDGRSWAPFLEGSYERVTG